MSKPKLGLALGSGGARGWCHIGVLRALHEMGITPDVIAGSSMGALVGAAYAGGCLDALEVWARAQTRRSILGLMDVRLTGGGILGATGVVAMLNAVGLTGSLQDLPIPFTAVAADVRTGHEIWLRHGPAAQAVRASVAMPGLISPQRIDGRWLMDGGVVNPVPVSAARALGADVVIAVNPNAAISGAFWTPVEYTPGLTAGLPGLSNLSDLVPALPKSIPDALRNLWSGGEGEDKVKDTTPSGPAAPAYVALINAAIDIMSDQIRRSRLAGDAPHVLLAARLGDISVLEFHRAAEAIEEGRRITLAQEDWIRTCIGG